jgi:hypothetical protein
MITQTYKKLLINCFIISFVYSLPLLSQTQDIKKFALPKLNAIKKSSAQAKLDNNAFYEIQKSDTKELIIEISIPEFTVEKSTHQGIDFLTINIPGYSQIGDPGKPQLPIKGFLVGIPPGSNFKLTILDYECEILQRCNIRPAPAVNFKQDKTLHQQFLKNEDITHKFLLDQSLYSTNNFFPAQIATTGSTALIRNQNVASFQIFPIQFNPVTQEIRCYKKIKIKVDFLSDNINVKSAGNIIDKSIHFEKLLKTSLLNYEVAKHWKQTSTNLPKNKSINKNAHLQTQGTRYKILIEFDGIYRLTHYDLEQAGINTSLVDPRKIRIFNKGVEIPIYVKGQVDAVFDESDYIEFYGIQIKNEYGHSNVYWLSVDEETAGLRMVEKDGSFTGSPPTLMMSSETIHFEKNKTFNMVMPHEEGADHWFWNYASAPDTHTFRVTLNNVSAVPKTNCSLAAEFHGYTQPEINPDHHTIVALNEYTILDDWWDGCIRFNSWNGFHQNHLHDGINDISLILPGDTGAGADGIWVNWFEITYWRDYVAHNDSLIFWGEGMGPHQFVVQNFISNEISVFDITESTDVKRITNIVSESTDTLNVLRFQDNITIKHQYYALTEDKKRTPVAIFADEASQLFSEINQADYIIITHEDFYEFLTPLVNLRQRQGLNVKTVKTTDIYDEFNFGIKDPHAIKDFLSYAYSEWQKPSPSYVLLFGDASLDYKDFFQIGTTDFVPTHLFKSTHNNFYTSSDNWFVCVNGDDNLPDMFIGRLPVKTANEAEIVVNKLIGYDNNKSKNWNKKILFIADDTDDRGNYANQSDQLIHYFVPSDFTVLKSYLTESIKSDPATLDSFKHEIISRLNEGCLITNYIGHGSNISLAHEHLLDITTVTNLNNNYNLPLVVSLSCLSGYFHWPTTRSLSEVLLVSQNGGAIGCFAPSGFANTYVLPILGRKLYDNMFQNQDYILGSVFARSKMIIFALGDYYFDHIEFYNFFGDPATRLNVYPELTIQPSCYTGNILIENNPAQIGAELSGWINNLKYPTNFHILTPGKYGPLYISADDPATQEIEGGKNGDSVGFKLVTITKDTFLLYPSTTWETGVMHNVDLNTFPTSVHMKTLITIEINVNDKIVGSEIMSGDPIPNNSLITAKLEAKDNGLNRDKINILLNGQFLEKDNYTYLAEENNSLHNGKIIYSPSTLSDGEYEMIIEVYDLASPANQTKKSFFFKISSTLQLERVYNFPNPMQTNTTFTYLIFNDKNAAVHIKIYTIAGRLIKTIYAASGDVGYNETVWDGRDSNNDVIANGVYFYKITAKDGKKTTELIERLVMMR